MSILFLRRKGKTQGRVKITPAFFWGKSFAGEVRFALLQESGNALHSILAGGQFL
jgi:hypothetical protein